MKEIYYSIDYFISVKDISPLIISCVCYVSLAHYINSTMKVSDKIAESFCE